MISWFWWLVALLRAWLGIRADIQQKQQEHAGQLEQQNADLQAEANADEAALKAAANSLDQTKAKKLEALREGAE